MKSRLALAAHALIWACALPPPSNSETLTLQAALSDAISGSFDLRISAADTNIKRAAVKSERADLLPQLRATYSSEYLANLTGQGVQNVAVVGNTILPGNTRNQNVVSFNLTHNLFDAGAQRQELKAAKLHAVSARTQQAAVLQDLKLNVVKLYVELLLSYTSLQEKVQEVKIYRDVYQIKKRFFDAGKISRVELGENALQIQSADDSVEQARQDFVDCAGRLSQLTQKTYDLPTLQVMPIELVGSAPSGDSLISNSPDIKATNQEIQAVKAELTALQRQKYPVVGLYSGVVFYGASENSWWKSFGSMGPRQVNLGINMSLPIFDGFKNRAECMKKQFEIQKLVAIRDKKISELHSEYDRLGACVGQYGVELKTKVKLLKEGEEQLVMVKRLSDSLIKDKTTYFQEQIAQLQKNLSEERVKAMQSAALLRMQILAEG